VSRLERSLPKAATVLADAEDEVTAYAAFPRHHRRKIWSTNPLERVNKEIKRRTNVVDVFPNDDAALRPVGRSSPNSTTNARRQTAATSP